MTTSSGSEVRTDYPPELAPVRAGEELDWVAAERYLREQIDGLGPLVQVLQFPNGSANLTYFLEFEDRKLVLRRPPFGHIAVGAHDMSREFKALSGLWRCFDRAPRPYLFCADHTVLGADLLVSEYRPGQVIWGRTPPSMAHHPDIGRRVGFAVVDALADLHLLNPTACGLGDLGRPEGFVARQVSGWRKRWEASAAAIKARVPLMDEVGARLTATMPESPRVSILHNDYKVDNCQFDREDPDRVQSIFDWDMATVGDPLVDVGTLLNYWPDPSDDPDDRPIYPDGLDTFGLPTRAEVVERYAARTGAAVDAVGWYEAFACWRTSVVVQQLYARYVLGETSDERQGAKGEWVESLAHRAAGILDRTVG